MVAAVAVAVVVAVAVAAVVELTNCWHIRFVVDTPGCFGNRTAVAGCYYTDTLSEGDS